jgi:large subunit ribosomal protein L9
MKVILRSDVQKVGRAGDIKEVSTGFGRNYLLPKNLAMVATPAALKQWEKGKEKRSKLVAERQKEFKALADKINGVGLSFSRPASEGKLFGSVGKSDIVKSLKSCGFAVEKDSVHLDTAIKQVGDHEIEVRLMHDVTAKIKVTIVARE